MRRHQFSLKLAVLGVSASALLIWLVVPSRDERDRAACRANLRAIGVALQGYVSDFGCFPPAFVAGPDGRPWHSWRVLILPQLGEHALFKAYDFGEPWDGPNNRKLMVRLPAVYSCPAHDDPTRSDYAAITGAGAAFPETTPTSPRDFYDGTYNSIMIAEVRGSDSIPWTQPRDLRMPEPTDSLYESLRGHGAFNRSTPAETPADRMSLTINDPSKPSIGSLHRGGPHVLMADGTVVRLHKRIYPGDLYMLLTIAAGDLRGCVDTPSGAPPVRPPLWDEVQ